MAFDILAALPKERADAIRAKVAAESRELARLHALPDRWLGQAVLDMAREVRRRVPDYGVPGRGTYDDFLLWQAVPLVAKRLGCPLLPNEATDPDVLCREGDDLRRWLAQAVEHFSSMRVEREFRDDAVPNAALLCHSVANGNPLAIALDRVVPPHASSDDYFASEVREISRRRGFEPTESWWPGMQATRPDTTDDLDDSGAMARPVRAAEVGFDDSGARDHEVGRDEDEVETPSFR